MSIHSQGHSNAFLTTIYPENEEYLIEFFNSLSEQTFKGFDLIVVNDGCRNIREVTKKFDKMNIILLNYSSTPTKNRQHGINYVVSNNYENIIFGDSDDLFDNNRLRVSVDLLSSYDIVVNDLSTFQSKSIHIKNYISNRVANNTEIDIEFIRDKNIFGLSNTSLKAKLFKEINLDSDMVALDWFIFSRALLQNARAVFTNTTETYYRQHGNNTIGIGKLTSDFIYAGVAVKIQHYGKLMQLDSRYEEFYYEIKYLQEKIADSKYVERLVHQKMKYPLWWEMIKLIR